MLEFFSIDESEAGVYLGDIIYKENKVIYLNEAASCVSFHFIHRGIFEEGTWLKKDGKFLIILDVASYYA